MRNHKQFTGPAHMSLHLCKIQNCKAMKVLLGVFESFAKYSAGDYILATELHFLGS